MDLGAYYRERHARARACDLYAHGRSDLAAQRVTQTLSADLVHTAAVDRDDGIARLQSDLLGRTPRKHAIDVRLVRCRHERDDRPDAADLLVAQERVELLELLRKEQHRIGIVQGGKFARKRGLNEIVRVNARAVAREAAKHDPRRRVGQLGVDSVRREVRRNPRTGAIDEHARCDRFVIAGEDRRVPDLQLDDIER